MAYVDKNLFYYFLFITENWTFQSKFVQKMRFGEFIPLDRNETFSFYHF